MLNSIATPIQTFRHFTYTLYPNNTAASLLYFICTHKSLHLKISSNLSGYCDEGRVYPFWG